MELSFPGVKVLRNESSSFQHSIVLPCEVLRRRISNATQAKDAILTPTFSCYIAAACLTRRVSTRQNQQASDNWQHPPGHLNALIQLHSYAAAQTIDSETPTHLIRNVRAANSTFVRLRTREWQTVTWCKLTLFTYQYAITEYKTSQNIDEYNNKHCSSLDWLQPNSLRTWRHELWLR